MGKEELKAQFKADVAAAQDAAADKFYEGAFAEGLASAPASQPAPDVQAQIDVAVAKKADEDKAKLDDMSAQLAAVQADDDAQKAKVAAQQEVIEKIKALLG